MQKLILQVWQQNNSPGDLEGKSLQGPFNTYFMQILVFKTNLSDTKRVSDAAASLDVHPHIFEWNVDLHDVDNILRIVSKNIEAREIEELVLNAGYYCEELL